MKRVRAYIDDFNLKNCEINKHKSKDIWIYSGYTFEEIMKQPSMIALIEMADVLVDGRFIQEKLNLEIDLEVLIIKELLRLKNHC